jgi:tripartite-type tricarboxylate transporter receptor subunit TctC
MTDLLMGHIQLMLEPPGTSLPPIKAGLLRPLGVSSTARIADLPDVPTIAESGNPDYRGQRLVCCCHTHQGQGRGCAEARREPRTWFE